MNRRAFTTTSSAAAFACFAGQTPAARLSAQTPAPIRIGVLPPGDISAEPYYASAQGYFQAAGLDATVVPNSSTSAMIAAVTSGQLDVAYSNVITLAVARERGIPIALLAPANIHVHEAPTAGILAVKRTSPIRTAADLSGKLVAVELLNNIAQISARDWIDKNGGDSTAVKFVEITLSAMAAAVIAGRVDAAVMNAVFDTTAGTPDDPLRRLCSSTFDAISPAFAPSAWFSTPQWVAAHPAVALGFVRAMRQTAAWANAHHAATAAILVKYTGQSVADIESVRRVTYGGAIAPGMIQPAIDAAAKYGLIKADFPAAEMIAAL